MISRNWARVLLLVFAVTIFNGRPAHAITPPTSAASKSLLDLSSPDIDPNLARKNDQVKISKSTDATAPGINVIIQTGADAYPGVIIKPATPWDLSAFGHIEVRVTNLGDAPLDAILQVDNAGDWRNAPWNAEQNVIKPGATGTVSVTFGYGYGHQLGYPLKSSEVSRVLVFALKAKGVQTFRIDSVMAAGAAGEKPPVDLNSLRTKPKGGVIAGPGISFDLAKQIEAKGGATVTAEDAGLRIGFTAAAGEQTVLLKPLIGRWDLGDATQVRVKVKNTGSDSVTPAILLTSEKFNTTEPIPPTPLAPGDEKQFTIRFAPTVRWQGTPSAGIFKGAVSGEKTGSSDVVAGTGTRYASDRTDGIKISVTHQGEASLLVESIAADSPVAQNPDWLGTRPPVDGDWVKTFDDDFKNTTLDASKWNNTGPNYWDKISHWSKDNVILDGKDARLHYEKKTGYQNDDAAQKQTSFTGGYLDTFGKWKQRYGYFEARLKLPTAPGLWPAFWMMPDRGAETPDSPGSHRNRSTTSNGAMEFDIMEHLDIWGPHRYDIAMHWDDYGPAHKSIGTGKVYFQTDKDGFVTTGMLWTPGSAVYYCNGIEIAHWDDPRVSNVPSYMIVYMPTGGWDNNMLNGTEGLPDDFVVDYVRCWQRKDLVGP